MQQSEPECLFVRERRVEGSGCKVAGISQQSAGSISVINYEESQQVLMHKSNEKDEDHFKIPFVRFL